MKSPSIISLLDWTATPLEVIARWPADRSLVMLHSGRVDACWARWSVLATPTVRYQFSNDCRSRWVGASSESVPEVLKHVKFVHDPLRDVDAIVATTRLGAGDALQSAINGFPFHGGWIGYFSYDLGRVIELRAQVSSGAADDRNWPLIDLAWCCDALVFDHVNQQWFAVGDLAILEEFVSSSATDEAEYALGPLRSGQNDFEYMNMVRRTIDAIGAGDIYQANIAQRFTTKFIGSTRALCRAAFEQAKPWYGAYMELPEDRCIVSLSPELFLHVDPISRRVTTRPIKGTRPSTTSATTLRDSAKDTAELHMIVDLMRNDLGRACEFGSVRVTSARAIESHPTVHHGVGEVTGVMREGASIGDLLRATFPGGSVTGAPKIRAMQIIDELEPARRGPYCGAIGMISDCGAINLNIAIRTLLVSGGLADYWAGAGIVADSDPQAEYWETLDKTAVVQSLCRPSDAALAM